MKNPAFIIVIGTSAGGRNALIELIGQLKPEMNAAFFIVMHLSKKGIANFLVKELQPFTSLPCSIAEDRASIKAGQVYIAPSNGHLVIKKDQLMIGHGPEENRWRPSIDVLFRSAAASYSSRVIGIILTGLLNDGTSGMLAIKQSGGICVVQDPEEAEYPDMPLNVLELMEADYSTSLAGMGELLSGLLSRKPLDTVAPANVLAEAEIAERTVVGFENVRSIGEKSVYACPDCGGNLWNISADGVSRYRCHIGHSYQEKELLSQQGHHVEATLWIALRIMEERSHLLNKMGKDNMKKGLSRIGTQYLDSAKQLHEHVQTLKGVLYASQNVESK